MVQSGSYERAQALALLGAQQAATQLKKDADRATAAAATRRAPRGQPDTQANVNMRAGFVKDAQVMQLNAAKAQAQVNDMKANPDNYTNAQISDYSSRVVVSEATQKRQRQSQTRAVSAMQERGNQQIRDSQSTELKRLGGSGVLVSGNEGPTKTSETLGKGSRVTARQAQGTAPLNQPWESQFVYSPTPKGTDTQDPVKNWNEVKTEGVGMFSGVEQNQPLLSH